MQVPLQITFRHMEPSGAVETKIREQAAKLEQYYHRITSCRVIVEAPHQHHRHGRLYHVRIDLTVPQTELLVSRDPAEHHGHEDVYIAIRDAFNAARRRLENYTRRQRHEVKSHEAQPRGRVSKLYPEENYGFISAPDGREIYFHAHSVLNDAFARLEIGTEVHFAEEAGEKGPQASTVRVIAKHRVHG